MNTERTSSSAQRLFAALRFSLPTLRSFRVFLGLAAALLLAGLTATASFAGMKPITNSGTGAVLALAVQLRTARLHTALPSFAPHGTRPASVHAAVPAAGAASPMGFRYAPNGRAVIDHRLMRPGALLRPHAASVATATPIPGAVQTFDVFNPGPSFRPLVGYQNADGSLSNDPTLPPVYAVGLTPTNLTPVWSQDETFLVYSSNRNARGGLNTDASDGVSPRFHLWAISINGGEAYQITTSTGAANGGEFFPALTSGNNGELAFSSDAQTPGVQNLYVIGFSFSAVAVGSITNVSQSASIASVTNVAGTGFDQVQRPTISPSNSNVIVFAAHSTAGNYAGHYHIYFLNLNTGGFDPNNNSLPAKLTDGLADDTDPAYSNDGQFIAFASTAGSLTTQPQSSNGFSSAPNASQSLTQIASGVTATSNRSLFLLSGGSNAAGFGTGVAPNIGTPSAPVYGPITLAGTDNFGPSWSYTTPNQYTNPAPGFDYLAFGRGASQTSPHNIYYLQTIRSTNAQGETGKSYEAATTPQPAATPVYQIDAGSGSGVSNYSVGDANGFGGLSFATGGAQESNTNTFSTLNDPGTPAQIYNTDRIGTTANGGNNSFSYTLPNLTPGANYTIRLHFADPKDTLPGKRVFNIAITGDLGQQQAGLSNFDIVQTAQQSPGHLGGLVQDTTGTAIANATITVTDYNTGAAVTTTPAPITTTGTTTNALDNRPGNYAANLVGSPANDAYIVTATAPGFGTESQVVYLPASGFSRANFTLSSAATGATDTISGTVTDSNGNTIPNTPVMVSRFDASNNLIAFGGTSFATSNAPQVTTDSNGQFTVTVPAATAGTTYQVTVSPQLQNTPTSTYTTQTRTVTATPGTPATPAFTLQSGAGVGDVLGLVSDKTTTLPVAGAVVQVLQGGTAAAILLTSGTAASPAAPTGDTKPENYIGFLPVGSGYQVRFSEYNLAASGAPQPAAVTIVNTAGPPANEAARADGLLTSSNPATNGQNTAVMLTFPGIIATSEPLSIPPSATGRITINFTPTQNSDPPIVQGIEAISDTAPATSSGFGGDAGTSAPSAPFTVNAIGGTDTAGTVGQVVLNWSAISNAVAYNVYRSPQIGSTTLYPTTTNRPNSGGSGLEGNIPYASNVIGTTFTDTGVTVGDEYRYQVTAVLQQAVTPENNSTNTVIKLNTDDNAGETSVAGNAYDDIYPTWSPFHSIFSIAYSSNRSVSYNDPATGLPTETAISLTEGSTVNEATGANSYTVGGSYAGILESQVLNLDPPTLLRFSSTETVHIQPQGTNPVTGTPTKYGVNLTGGKTVTMTVRLSNREAGIDDNNVYVQIKDPDSKYQDNPRQDGTQLEHKVFAKDFAYNLQANQPTNDMSDPVGFNANDYLPLGGPGVGSGVESTYQDIVDTWPTYGVRTFEKPRGALGGFYNGTNTHIYIGKSGGGNNQSISTDNRGSAPVYTQFPGDDPNLFIPWGPEYECQFVNSSYAGYGTLNADAAITDYGTPYYLAGVNDQQPFSGDVNPPRTEWLKLTRVPSAQQDNKGGVLYTADWTTPITGSDFYLDVIAYDKAVFPSFPANTSPYSGRRTNWRIYDNVGGFSTNVSIGSNDILVVSDYALGQKFAGTTFSGSNGNLNLVPKLYGAESYLTDVDVNILPDTQFAGYPTYIDNNNRDYGPLLQPFSLIGLRTLNGLGVGSYSDSSTSSFRQGSTVDGVPYDNSQKYSIWRILARGPVPQSVLQAYVPTKQVQPAVLDLQGPAAFQGIPAATVLDAHKCVIWLSPFTGDLLTDPGALDDPGSFNIANQPNRNSTQTILRNFVQAGGRLFITGQDVGSGLTLGGTVGNGTGGFLSDVLNATLASANGGSNTLVGSANRITGDPGYDSLVGGSYLTIVGDNLATLNYPYLDRLILGNAVQSDGSLDQRDSSFPLLLPSGASLLGQLDTLAPQNGAKPALAYGTANGPVAMVFHDDPYSAAGAGTLPNGGTGSRVVFAGFGLEGLSSDVYASEGADPNKPFFVPPAGPRNPRPEILHNIICFLRTGSVSGLVTQTSGTGQGAGQGVGGVTVYLQPATGTPPPTRATFSATTNGQGLFTILGVEPGQYKIAAYKAGFSNAVANVGNNFVVEGDVNVSSQALTIAPLPPGKIAGTVTDTGGNPIPDAQVNFTSRDQTVTVNGVTFGGTNPATTSSPSGSYFLPSVPVTEYDTATAISPTNPTGQPEYQNAPAPQPPYNTATAPPYNTKVVVQANTTTQPVNFILTPIPATISGTITNSTSGAVLPGATVTLTNSAGTAVGTPVVTAADGTYTLSGIPASTTATTYTLKVTAPGFAPGTATATVYLGSIVTGLNVALAPIPPGSIKATVTYSTGGPVANAVVTYTASGGAAQTAVTAADGTVTLANLPAGVYTVSAIGPNNTTTGVPTTTAAAAQQITVTSGAQSPANFVVTAISPSFAGTVTNAAGAALANATITVTDGSGAIVTTTKSGMNGAYATGTLTPGTYTVTASLAGYGPVSRGPTTVQYGDMLTGQNFTLVVVPPGSITGTVKDSNGAAVANAVVTFNSTDGTVTGQTATTNASGTYVIPPTASTTNVPASTYTGTAVGPNNQAGTPEYGSDPAAPKAVTVQSGITASVNFTLPVILASVAGTITDAQTGAVVPGATVTLTSSAGTTISGPFTTLADGKYNFTGILATQAASNYTLTVTAPGYFASKTTVALSLGDHLTKSVTLNEQGTVGGLVTDQNGTALVSGAVVTFLAAGQTTGVTFTTTASSSAGPDGSAINYTGQIATGTYSVTVTKSSRTTAAKTITVRQGVFNRLDFTATSGLPVLHTFPAGIQFVSAPYDYSALGFNGLFGALSTAANPSGNRSNVAVWNPLIGAYALDPTAPADALRPGVGYWVYLKSATSVTQQGAAVAGTTTSTGTYLAVPLSQGWNQIGVPNPATTGVPISSLMFDNGTGGMISFSVASGSQYNLVTRPLYAYVGGSAYQTLTATSGVLMPWTGYWIYANAAATLEIPTK